MKKIAMALGLTVALGVTSNAQIFDNHQVGVNVGTLGAGLEYSSSFNDTFALRTGFNTFSYDMSLTESDVKYDAELELKTIALLVDYHPFANGLRLSAGAMYNGNEFKVTAKPDGAGIELNGYTYNSTELGQVDGKVDFKKIAPYAGLGYSSSKTKTSGFSFNMEIGALFQGAGTGKLDATCGSSIVGTALCDQVQRDVAEEEKQLNKELKDFEIYPVISTGIGYKF